MKKTTTHDVQLIAPGKLKPHPKNSRTHSDLQVKQLAASIREFGFTRPVLIQDDLTVIAGHGAVMAALQVGLKEVPCIKLSHLTPEQVRAYIIADNKLAMNSGWDRGILKEELAELEGLDFDLTLTGFEVEELKYLLEDKVDNRYLEDFDITPKPKPVWVLIATDDAQLGKIKNALTDLKLKDTRVEISNAKGEKAEKVK